MYCSGIPARIALAILGVQGADLALFTAILHRLYIGQIVHFTFVRYHSTCKINEWQRKARAMKEKSRKNRWHFSWKQHEEVLKEEKI